MFSITIHKSSPKQLYKQEKGANPAEAQSTSTSSQNKRRKWEKIIFTLKIKQIY
jgi:hypothetical protein